MPIWLTFAIAAVFSFLKSFYRTRKARAADVSKGAEDQRKADDEADAKIVAEAKEQKDATDAAPDGANRERLRKWVRRPEPGEDSR